MSNLQAFFLAIIQGLTEFLPISSSGHLVIFQKIFGLKEAPVLFDILVHLGTLGATIIFLRQQVWGIIRGVLARRSPKLKIFILIVVGTIPAAIVGFFLQRIVNEIFNSLTLVGFSLLVTAALLFLSKRLTRLNKDFRQMDWRESLFVGLFQALAILPGVSRSGSTIVAGLARGLNRETAFRFSFFLAIPAILGAAILQIPDIFSSQFIYLNQAIFGMLVAGVTGYLALALLQKILRQGKLWFFGFYCLALGIFLLLFKINNG